MALIPRYVYFNSRMGNSTDGVFCLQVLPVVKTMRPHTLQSNTLLVTNVLGGCAVGYLMIGLGGYLSFRKSTAGNVLRNVDG